MTTSPDPRFDIEALRRHAGAAVFGRGEAYHRDGLVRIVTIEPGRVLAEVEGSDDYRVELLGTGSTIGGTCSCPAFPERGFCKHLVAVALLEARLAAMSGTPYSWNIPAELLVRIHMREADHDAAWAVAGRHRVSLPLAEALAKASEATHPRQALAAYAARVEQLVGQGGNPAYAEAAALIGRMATLQGKPEQVTYVLGVKLRHGRKRNFIRLLG